MANAGVVKGAARKRCLAAVRGQADDPAEGRTRNRFDSWYYR